ncbi:P-loop containing nucleoside triphosphate hydrolase [Sesbania bispinosa]|nr:P-loop containing nucleoside triphosphate hydrolase [Sesbania bispinosa]
MLRTFTAALESSRKILTSLSSAPSKWRAPSPYSTSNDDPASVTLPKLLVVQPRLRPEKLLQAKLNEALCLANSLEEQRDGYFHTDFFDKPLPPHLLVQNPSIKGHKPRADTYFGPGTVDNIKCHLNAAESNRAWNKPVLDRVGLIIEIFNAHAFTKEAKLQAELAALSYKKTRLVRARGPDGRYTFGSSGEAEVVSARGRGSGGQGFMSGAGETELQLQRRRILERRNYLLKQIEEVRRTRALQRAGRKRHGGSFGQGLATVAVVGYTNAGKSTLVSKLSDSDLYSDCRLFATVDPRLRSAVLPSGRKVLLSDTVGFISDLPVQLVEAFHATLEEVVEADLLVSLGDTETIEEKEDYSDGWLYDDTLVNEDDFSSPSSVADQQNESYIKGNGMEKDSLIGQSGPHVKTSAFTGVGLQELLELIDKKLSSQDEKLKTAQVVERNIFDRKWRPSHTQDSSIAVEQ